MIEIVGAPFDLCGFTLGSRLGPSALRLAGLVEAIERLGPAVQDLGDLPTRLNRDDPERLEPLLHALGSLRGAVGEILARGNLPLVLGGEHTLAAASVAAGLASEPGMALLWIDAHADVNTPGSSPTGNYHGMPIAALAGLPAGKESAVVGWERLRQTLNAAPLELSRVGWFGLRDVDPSERANLGGLALTMHDVDRYGVESCFARVAEWLAAVEATGLWVSFDVDVLDPILAPGTGTAVRGGLSYREGHLLAELLCEHLARRGPRLIGVDVMETNPITDHNNATATVAVEWIASLFGKRILGEGFPPPGVQ